VSSPSLAQRIRGCLLGGAVGDALGAPIEFEDLGEIDALFGRGPMVLREPFAFTDDTQLTLFGVEALLICGVQLEQQGTCHPPQELHRAYLRWLATQRGPQPPEDDLPGGWLGGVRLLHRSMSPGTTCLGALASGQMGRMSARINDSKGCGGVMRAAPGGFLVPGVPPGASPAEAYHLGCEMAAVTHGHDDGIHPAGALSAIISVLVGGGRLVEAVEVARSLTSEWVAECLGRALAVGRSGPPSGQELTEHFGGGWVGDEALAIAVACAVAPATLEAGLEASVRHSGDSDSTGAICGNLLGAALGEQAIPARWLDDLDGRWLVEEVADDCLRWLAWSADPGAVELGEGWLSRYA
jgi:ADP-ribosylglycohydrolase